MFVHIFCHILTNFFNVGSNIFNVCTNIYVATIMFNVCKTIIMFLQPLNIFLQTLKMIVQIIKNVGKLLTDSASAKNLDFKSFKIFWRQTDWQIDRWTKVLFKTNTRCLEIFVQTLKMAVQTFYLFAKFWKCLEFVQKYRNLPILLHQVCVIIEKTFKSKNSGSIHNTGVNNYEEALLKQKKVATSFICYIEIWFSVCLLFLPFKIFQEANNHLIYFFIYESHCFELGMIDMSIPNSKKKPKKVWCGHNWTIYGKQQLRVSSSSWKSKFNTIQWIYSDKCNLHLYLTCCFLVFRILIILPAMNLL